MELSLRELDHRTRTVTRLMAWERIKGELRSILETYWDESREHGELSGKIDKFIEDVDSNW